MQTSRPHNFLSPWGRVATLASLCAGFAAVLLLFNRAPALDIAVSAYFFTAEVCATATPAERVCGQFAAESVPVLAALRRALQALPVVIAVVLLVVLVVRRLRLGALDLAGTRLCVALGGFVLSAGLLVNGIIKTWSGRPRPIATDLFGGDMPFAAAGDFTGACASNCSFVSGESASAFWLVALPALAPPAWRLPLYVAALVLASVTAFLRVAFGGHYVSDVILAAIVTLAIFSALALVVGNMVNNRGRNAASNTSG